jgi:hypothetical protein
MAADKLISNSPCFHAKKLFRVNGSIYGIAGEMSKCLQFVAWRKNVQEKPQFTDSDNFCAIELTPKGKIMKWEQELFPIEVDSPFYAIGSGAAYALGAASAGKTPRQAVQIAARWDEATGSEVQTMSIK